MTKTGKKRRRHTRRPPSASPGNSAGRGTARAAWAAMASFLVLAFFLILIPSYHVLPGLAASRRFWAWVPAALAFAALLFWSRRMPVPPDRKEPVGRALAWTLLALVLGVGAWLRLCHYDLPVVTYWGDNAQDIIDPLNMLEHSEHPLVLVPGAREPFYYYFSALCLRLLPGLSLVEVQHVSSTVLDLVTVWLLYLLGRELGGRRTGLLAAALAAVSKPLVMKVLLGLRHVTLPLAVCLVLLFFFRTLKKPTQAHFFQWAAALAFGAYTYSSFRAFVPFLILALLAWILRRAEERSAFRQEAAMLGTILAYLFLVLLYASGYLGTETWVRHLLSPLLIIPLGILFADHYVRDLRHSRFAVQGRLLNRWLLAVLAAMLLMVPILSETTIVSHLAAQALVQKGGALSWGLDFPWRVLKGFSRLIATLFVSGPDRSDYSTPGEAFLDLPTVAVLFLGLAAFWARRDRRAAFLLLCVPVGAAADLLSIDYDSGKILGGLPPLLVLAAWGALRFSDGFRAAVAGRRGAILPGLALSLLVVGGLGVNQRHIYRDWALSPERRDLHVRLAEQAEMDYRDRQVFITVYRRSFGNRVAQQALQDGRGVRQLQGRNFLPLRPEDRPRDVVVLYDKMDWETVERLRREFPGARWSDVFRGPGRDLEELPDIGRVLIPKDQIPVKDVDDPRDPFGPIPTGPRRDRQGRPFDMVSEHADARGGSSNDARKGPRKLFEFVRVPETGWVRTYYGDRCGLDRGIIEWVDWVPSLDAARSPEVNGFLPVRFTGSLETGAVGKVNFVSDESGNYVLLRVDGERVLDVRPHGRERGAEGSADLGPGRHRIELVVYLRTTQGVPAIRFKADELPRVLSL